MGASSTVYDVMLRFRMAGQEAMRGVDLLERKLRKASKGSNLLRNSLAAASGAAVGFFGFRAASKALVGFNSDLEQARIQMAGLMMQNLGGTFEGQLERSNVLVEEMVQKAKMSTSTTAEMVDFLRNTIQPLTAAGMKAHKLADFTHKALVAAKAFGDEDVAQLDIQQALNQNVQVRDRFMQKLLGTIRMTHEEFNELDKPARLKTIERALNHPSIMKMAKAQENSFAGVFSTLKDNLEIFLGKVGLPLFQALTAEIKSWNTWIDRNGDKLNRIAKDFSQSLMSGFRAVKQAVSWIAEHKDLLLTLGKAILVLKGAKAIGGIIGAGMGGIKTVAGILTGGFTMLKTELGLLRAATIAEGAGGKLTNVGKAGVAGAVVAGGLAAGIYLRKKFDEGRESQKSRVRHVGWMKEDMAKGRADLGFYKLKGYLDDQGNINMAKLRKTALMGGAGQLSREELVKFPERIAGLIRATEIMDKQARSDEHRGYIAQAAAWKRMYAAAPAWGKAIMDNMSQTMLRNAYDHLDPAMKQMFAGIGEYARKTAEVALGWAIPSLRPKEEDLGWAAKKGTKVNVTINRIEVASDDPDRFVMGMVDAFRDAAKNPSGAARALREG